MNVCVCVFGHLQGAPADEPDGLAAGSGRQREAGAGHAQLLRAVQEDLHRRPGAEIVKGKDASDAAAIGSHPEVKTSAACRGSEGGGLDRAGLCQVFFVCFFFVLSPAVFHADTCSASAVAANVSPSPPIVVFDVVYNAPWATLC